MDIAVPVRILYHADILGRRKSGEYDLRFALKHSKDAKGNDVLEVASNDGTDFAPEEMVKNFRMYYKAMLGVEMIDYTGLSAEENAALAADSSNMMYLVHPYDAVGQGNDDRVLSVFHEALLCHDKRKGRILRPDRPCGEDDLRYGQAAARRGDRLLRKKN